jgi:ankyrin repeat protein
MEIASTYQQCMDMKVLSSDFSMMAELILVLLITTEIIAFTYQQCMDMKVLSKLLLEDKRIDHSVVDSYGDNCLHLSAMRGHESIVKLLLEDKRIDHSVVNNDGNNCLHFSAMNGHESVVKLLLEDGRVDPCAVNSQ